MADEHHEIVIIRRGGHGDHDDHHGGVWKIAFADFMTAMMAFFLVMWLISANDKTRASVARYFNPVRLVDATTQPRGLHNTKKDESGITASPDNKKADDKKEKPGGAGEDGKTDKAEAPGAKTTPDKSAKADEKSAKAQEAETASAREARLDKALQESPMTALAEIAGPKSGMAASEPAALAKPVVGRRGGDAYRDPFAPPPPDIDRPTTDPAKEDALLPLTDPAAAPPPVSDHPAEKSAAKTAEDHTVAEPADDWLDQPSTLAAASATLPATPSPSLAGSADGALKAMAKALNATGNHDAPKMDVQRTGEGLLISLTDTADYSMFASGSAVPSRKLIAAMETLAGLLKDRPGTIVLRGFTDNKPYRSKRYDNWHLSLDRAQVAHYMLVRGGLDDSHFSHVEGYADRHARVGVDPGSPLNRRIEVLVRDTP